MRGVATYPFALQAKRIAKQLCFVLSRYTGVKITQRTGSLQVFLVIASLSNRQAMAFLYEKKVTRPQENNIHTCTNVTKDKFSSFFNILRLTPLQPPHFFKRRKKDRMRASLRQMSLALQTQGTNYAGDRGSQSTTVASSHNQPSATRISCAEMANASSHASGTQTCDNYRTPATRTNGVIQYW